MKRKFFLSLLATLLVIMVSISGYANDSTTDNGFVNTDTYEDFSYWQMDNLDLVTNLSIEYIEDNSYFNDTKILDLSLSNSQRKKIASLKKAICNYFSEKYNIDFSQKINQQKIYFFKDLVVENDILPSYIDSKDSNILYLNVMLNTQKYTHLFEYAYVQETLHQLGFYDTSGKLHFLVEGIVDAYIDLILTSNGFVFETDSMDIYFEARQLGYQMIAADKDLPNVFVNNLSLQEHINNALVGYTQNFLKKNNLAQYLEQLIDLFIIKNLEIAYIEDAFCYEFDAQMIVQRFCQSQNCDESQISYIRKHYIVEDFEKLKVSAELPLNIDDSIETENSPIAKNK